MSMSNESCYIITDEDIIYCGENFTEPHYKSEDNELGYEAWFLIKRSFMLQTEPIVRLAEVVADCEFQGEWPEDLVLLVIYYNYDPRNEYPDEPDNDVFYTFNGQTYYQYGVTDEQVNAILESLKTQKPNVTKWYFDGHVLQEEKDQYQ